MKERLSNSLRQGLGGTAPSGSHPDADMLTAFAEGTLTSREREGVLSHLAACAACREIVVVAGGAAPEPVHVAPELAAKPARPPLRSWLPWVATAASIVVVCSAVLLRELPRKSADQPVATETAAVQSETKPQQAPPPSKQKDRTANEKTVLTAPTRQANAEAPASAEKKAKEERSGEQFAKKSVVIDAQTDRMFRSQSGVVTSTEPSTLADVRPLPKTAQGPTQVQGGPEALGRQRLGLGNNVQINQAQNNQPAERDSYAANRNSTQQMRSGQVAGAQVSQGAPPVRSEAADYATNAQAAPAFTPPLAAIKVARADTATPPAARPHWRIDDSGSLQRSFGNEQWSGVLQNQNTRFRVVAVMGNEVWAGGDNLRLYHSLDNGTTWTAVEVPKKNGAKHDISRIRFQTPQSGTIESEDGMQWVTTDGGKSWK